MKSLFFVLILISSLQSWTKADEVSDLQINNFSVGDSLLKFQSTQFIEQTEKYFFPGSKKFYRISLKVDDENYDFVAFYLKYNDKKYKIYGLEGLKYIKFSECKKKMEKIKNNMKKNFNQKYKIINNEHPHSYDKTKKSTVKIIDFISDKHYTISRIICTDWPKKMEKQKFYDNLAIYLQSEEFSNFMLNEAY